MEQPTNTNLLDGVGKIIPLGSIIIIFLSAIKQILYYNAFNIDIIGFLSITEFLLLFMDELVLFAFILTVPLIFFLGKKAFSSTSPLYKKSSKNRVRTLIIVLGINLLGLLAVGLKPLIFPDRYGHDEYLLFFLVIDWVAIVFLTGIFLYPISIGKTSDRRLTIPIGFTLAFYILIQNTFLSINRVKNGDNLERYTINFETEVIKTNDDLVYVGKTDKYLFLYHISQNKSLILKTDSISKITISEKAKEDQN